MKTDSGITWEELLEEYFFSRRLRPATEWSYRKVVRVFRRYFSDVSPAQITHQQVLEWRRYILKTKGQTPQTWNNKIAHMRALYNHALEHELLITGIKNPFNRCNVRKESRKKKTLSRAQLVRIALIMQQHELAERKGLVTHRARNALYPSWFWTTVVDTFRYTGMRLNQLLHVRIRDVHTEEGYLDLRIEGSKTHREWRIPLVTSLRARLKHLITVATEAGANPDNLLFDVCRVLGERKGDGDDMEENHRNVRSFFHRLTRECGFRVSPHRFRHTLATELMKSPERNLKLVKDLLGHQNVSTTMEYVEFNMEIAGQALEKELSLYTDVKNKEIFNC